MKKLATVLSALALAALAVPVAQATPYGLEENPLGTMGWLPANANETPSGGTARLVMVYDHSLDPDTGEQKELLAKGPFGMKVFASTPDVQMSSHSPFLSSLDDLIDPQIAPVDRAFMGVAGDVRDGDCAKAGTASFSAAYSVTRAFFHAGETPYEPVSEPGTCEVVDSSEPLTDSEGAIIGYSTQVTNHVPGFWIDVTWQTRSIPLGLGSGYVAAELWYGSLFDTDGEDGDWWAVGDTVAQSASTGSPGDYTALYRFTANPGGTGTPCVNTGGAGVGAPDSWMDVKVDVPQEATKVTFRLFPKGDWDLLVFNPDGVKRTSGAFGGFNEQSVAPATANNANANQPNFPELVPGEYTMRGCNFTGETSVLGGVIIETA